MAAFALRSIIETHYFPSLAYFSLLQTKEFLIEGREHYQKRSFRNKCIIATANGTLTLTVPLKKGKHQQQLITETEISYAENWQHQHLQAIVSAYGRAPYFEHYIDEIEEMLSIQKVHLFELNLKILAKFRGLLNLSFPISSSDAYHPTTSYRWDYRNVFSPRNFTKWLPSLQYPQVFSDRYPFIPNLSVLDLLFCVGPEAAILLEENRVMRR